MAHTVDQLVEEASRLTPDTLAQVVDRLLWTLHGGQTADEVQAWSTLAAQRVEDVQQGRVQGNPGESTLASVRQPLGR